MKHAREGQVDAVERGERPATSVVLDELTALSDREGISTHKIREIAPALQVLPVVDDHRRLKRYSAADRHLAAYSTLGCYFDHANLNELWRTVLILTMRYDYRLLEFIKRERAAGRPDEWRDINRASSLTSRHKLIQALIGYGKSRYFEIVHAAYNELAAQLVMRDESPCRGGEQRMFSRAEVELEAREIMAIFLNEAAEQARELYAKKLLSHAHPSWRPTGDAAVERVQGIIREALGRPYSRVALELQREFRARSKSALQSGGKRPRGLVSGTALQNIFLTRLDVPLLDRIEKVPSLVIRSSPGESDGATSALRYRTQEIHLGMTILTGLLQHGPAATFTVTETRTSTRIAALGDG